MGPEASDIWANFGVFLAAFVALLSGYYGRPWLAKTVPDRRADPVITGIGLALGDKEQQERLISVHERMLPIFERIARSLESIADERQNDMKDTLEELLETVKPRPASPRKRTR